MNGSITFLLIVSYLSVCSVHGKAKMKEFVWLQEFKTCPEFEAPGKAYINGSFEYKGQGAFYGTVGGYSPYPMDHLYLLADIKKCPTLVMTEDCENMMTFPIGDQCIEKDSFFWDLMKKSEPPLSCPVLGHYLTTSAVLDSEKYMQFFRGLLDEEWLHVYIHVYSDKERLKEGICFVVIATVRKTMIREKTNRRRKH